MTIFLWSHRGHYKRYALYFQCKNEVDFGRSFSGDLRQKLRPKFFGENWLISVVTEVPNLLFLAEPLVPKRKMEEYSIINSLRLFA